VLPLEKGVLPLVGYWSATGIILSVKVKVLRGDLCAYGWVIVLLYCLWKNKHIPLFLTCNPFIFGHYVCLATMCAWPSYQCCKSLQYIADIPRYSKLNPCLIYPRYSEIFQDRPLSYDIFRDIPILSADVTEKLHSVPSLILSPRRDLQHCIIYMWHLHVHGHYIYLETTCA
jgi:hypothetical protein